MGHIPNIHALNSDIHTLRIHYEYTQIFESQKQRGVSLLRALIFSIWALYVTSKI